MGEVVQPILWAYFDDETQSDENRRVALVGLQLLAGQRCQRSGIIAELIRRLKEASVDQIEVNSDG